MRNDIYDFYALGLTEPLLISFVHGIGTGMLDAIVENLPNEHEEENPDVIKFSFWLIVPTLENQAWSMLSWEEDRIITSPVAGTTLVMPLIPAIATDTEAQQFTTWLIRLVCVSLVRFMKIPRNTWLCVPCVIDRSDVVLMVINAEEGILVKARQAYRRFAQKLVKGWLSYQQVIRSKKINPHWRKLGRR